MNADAAMVALDGEDVVQARGEFGASVGGCSEGTCARDVEVPGWVVIADQVGALFVNVSVQAQFKVFSLQPFQERILFNFLVACDRVVPDGNAE